MVFESSNTLLLILRIGVFGTFFGHGWLAANGNRSWLPYLKTAGVPQSAAIPLMRLIGIVDIIAAILVLIDNADELVILWCALWAFATALVRPFSGESIWAFVERAGNWATPLALLYLKSTSETAFLSLCRSGVVVFVAGFVATVGFRWFAKQ